MVAMGFAPKSRRSSKQSKPTFERSFLVHPNLSLAHLTVLSLPPPQMVRLAARTGFRAVGLRLIAVTEDSPGYPLMNDAVMLRETRAALADTGLLVLDIEFVKITPEIDVAALESFIAAGAALGARHVITAPYDSYHARLSDRLGAIANLAKPYGLSALLEFFPWTTVPDLSTAAEVVAGASSANVGILVDVLHFDRSGSQPGQLEALPARWLPMVHLCDAAAAKPATVEELLQTARAERLPPGEGGIDLSAILRRMPGDTEIALEVPMQRMTSLEGPEAVARHVHDAAIRFLAAMP
jgi:sugar phosphate isomerase/epimerase